MDLSQDEHYEYINGRKVLKKHVATIHCSNKLSLLERKISNALLFHAFPNLKDQLVHEITIDQLKRLLGANTRNHKALKDALKTLISTVIEWNLLGDNIPEMELEGWNASTILSSVSVKKGIIKYQYSELIKTLIIDPSIYGKINLVIQSRFKSAYALALYENCSRYRGLTYTKNIEMEIFRKLMGVEDGKYEIFRDFNRRVLHPAVTEINTCSDIRVTPEIFRRGRKVQSIQFKIEERPIKQRIGIQLAQNNVIDNETAINKKTLKTLTNQYGKEQVEKAIEYVKTRSTYQNGKINNLTAYVTSALSNGYEVPTVAEKKREILTNQQEREIHWRLNKHDYIRSITATVIQLFDQLSILEQKRLLFSFQEKCGELLGSHAELLTTTYYNLLGEGENRLQEAIQSSNRHVHLFFENGFVEFLLKVDDYFKKNIVSFDDFMVETQV